MRVRVLATLQRVFAQQAKLASMALVMTIILGGAAVYASSGAVSCKAGSVKANLQQTWNNNGAARDLILQGIKENNVEKIFDAYHSSHKYWVLIHRCPETMVMKIARDVAH